ncbi:MAG: hypothetical protein KDK70_01800 [Myxococcales bacterium]|nr:hypothetical protein [Myxococcales bacterium]
MSGPLRRATRPAGLEPSRRTCLQALLAAGAVLGAGGCAPDFKILPIAASPKRRAPVLMVFITGFDDHRQDLVDHGVIDVIERHGGSVDVLVVEGETPQYMSGEFTGEFNRRIVQTPRFQRYRRRILLGFSGGGTAALSYASGHPDAFDTMILYAPYLGPKFIVEEIAEAGGLARWQPTGPQEHQEALWVWLRRYAAGEVEAPDLYLLWSREDDVAVGLPLLEDSGLRERISVGSGEHGWPAFDGLWPGFVRDHARLFR